MDLQIKHLSLDDYSSYKTHIKSNVTLDFYTDFVNNILNDNHIILLLINMKTNEIIASGTLLIEKKLTYGGCKMGHIENILVEEKYRGNGYGKKIVEHLIEYARTSKCYRIDLSCEEKLVDFYSKIGFNNIIVCMSTLFKENFN